jgi:hypothetical protein
VHGCLLDGSSLFRCDRAAAFLRVGGCLVRTSCIVVGLTWPAFGGSLDHCMQVEGPSYFDRSRIKMGACRVKVTETSDTPHSLTSGLRLSDDCSTAHPAHAPFFGDDCAAAACGRTYWKGTFFNTHFPPRCVGQLLTLPHLFP